MPTPKKPSHTRYHLDRMAQQGVHPKKTYEHLVGEPFYLFFSVTVKFPEEAERFFSMASTKDALHLARAVKRAVSTCFRLPRNTSLVVVGQMYPVAQVMAGVNECEETVFCKNLSTYAKQAIKNLSEYKESEPINNINAVGIGSDQPGAGLGHGLDCEPPQTDYPTTIKCALPVIIVSNKWWTLSPWLDKLGEENEFWRVSDSRLVDAVSRAFGCHERIQTLGMAADFMLNEEVADILDSTAPAAVAEGAEDMLQLISNRMPLPDDCTLFTVNGETVLPFLTFDAFAEAHPDISYYGLGRMYQAYLIVYRNFCLSLIEDGVPFRVIRGSRDLFRGNEAEQRAALYSALSERIIDGTLIERSTQERGDSREKPSHLSVCGVLSSNKDPEYADIYEGLDESEDPDRDQMEICLIVTAADEQGILWQENLYPVVPSTVETVLAYIEKLEAEFGVKATWMKEDGIPCCPDSRKLMSRYRYGASEPKTPAWMMRH